MTTGVEALPLLHTRSYDVRSYRLGDDLRVVGSVEDVKPPGLYVADDPEPLPIHHMQVVLDVSVETLTIVDAFVEFRVHPHELCPNVVEHYGKLVGLSVTRGFNRHLRELFGGPRACSHTTALLQAMAPVVIQSLWSIRTLDRREAGDESLSADPEALEASMQTNVNTCHVWAEDGEMMTRVRQGEWGGEAPIWIKTRFEQLGRPLSEWTGE